MFIPLFLTYSTCRVRKTYFLPSTAAYFSSESEIQKSNCQHFPVSNMIFGLPSPFPRASSDRTIFLWCSLSFPLITLCSWSSNPPAIAWQYSANPVRKGERERASAVGGSDARTGWEALLHTVVLRCSPPPPAPPDARSLALPLSSPLLSLSPSALFSRSWSRDSQSGNAASQTASRRSFTDERAASESAAAVELPSAPLPADVNATGVCVHDHEDENARRHVTRLPSASLR